jgi:hypothetical protein
LAGRGTRRPSGSMSRRVRRRLGNPLVRQERRHGCMPRWNWPHNVTLATDPSPRPVQQSILMQGPYWTYSRCRCVAALVAPDPNEVRPGPIFGARLPGPRPLPALLRPQPPPQSGRAPTWPRGPLSPWPPAGPLAQLIPADGSHWAVWAAAGSHWAVWPALPPLLATTARPASRSLAAPAKLSQPQSSRAPTWPALRV